MAPLDLEELEQVLEESIKADESDGMATLHSPGSAVNEEILRFLRAPPERTVTLDCNLTTDGWTVNMSEHTHNLPASHDHWRHSGKCIKTYHAFRSGGQQVLSSCMFRPKSPVGGFYQLTYGKGTYRARLLSTNEDATAATSVGQITAPSTTLTQLQKQQLQLQMQAEARRRQIELSSRGQQGQAGTATGNKRARTLPSGSSAAITQALFPPAGGLHMYQAIAPNANGTAESADSSRPQRWQLKGQLARRSESGPIITQTPPAERTYALSRSADTEPWQTPLVPVATCSFEFYPETFRSQKFVIEGVPVSCRWIELPNED